MKKDAMTPVNRKIHRPSLLAPAGGFDSLRAALNAGADAVYFGVGAWNMRAGAAANFQPSDLQEIVRQCHESGVKAYLAVNTIVYDHELPLLRELCMAAKEAQVDACIAGDMAVVTYLRSIGMQVHMTVQCNICNLEAVKFYSQFADVMVLARELPLDSIRHIVEEIESQGIRGPSGALVRVEIFIHGALCVAISGKCYMSLAAYNASANRGTCYQNCRRSYLVRDQETGNELEVDNQYIMSPSDLCTIDFLDSILDAGPSLLKIEGRGRSADYVATTVSVYREAIDSYCAGAYDRNRIPEWKARLSEVFNRKFWEGGYYLGKTLHEWCATGGNQSTIHKTHAGKISNYFSKLGVAEMRLEAVSLHPGDRLLITGNATGTLDFMVEELRLDREAVPEAIPGTVVSFPVPSKVRTGDRVQLLTERVDGQR